MKTLNTIIATSTNGDKLIQFLGSNFSQPCFFTVRNNQVVSTYTMKDGGLITEGTELVSEVKKAINQQYDKKNRCSVEKMEFSSPMKVLSFLTGINYNGSLIDNSINVN